MNARYCKHCQIEHPLTKDFWYRLEASPRCKIVVLAKSNKRLEEKRDEILVYQKKWREKNKERHKEGNRKWRLENAEKHKQNAKDWYWSNRERAIATHVLYDKKRIKEDLNYRLSKNMRSRLHNAMRGGPKSASAIRHLGCTLDEFRIHLQNRFQEGMTWDNYGTIWEIDHIRPLANYDLTNAELAQELCHYTNLQPLFTLDNKKKSNKE